LYRLPELAQGKTESISVPEDLRAVVTHLLHENQNPHIVLRWSLIYMNSRIGSMYVPVWEKGMVERTEFRKDSIRIQMNQRSSFPFHYDIIEVVVNPADERRIDGAREMIRERIETILKYEMSSKIRRSMATFRGEEEQS